MIITQTTVNALPAAPTITVVKFAVLQRTPSYVSYDSGTSTLIYYSDSLGTSIVDTKPVVGNEPVFIITD